MVASARNEDFTKLKAALAALDSQSLEPRQRELVERMQGAIGRIESLMKPPTHSELRWVMTITMECLGLGMMLEVAKQENLIPDDLFDD